MEKDRKKISKIITEMLDNPEPVGIFKTTKAYDELEAYVREQRVQALGWMLEECCSTIEKGNDPRKTLIGDMITRAENDLGKEKKDGEESESESNQSHDTGS